LDWTATAASASLGLPSGKSSPAEPKSSSHVNHTTLCFSSSSFDSRLLPANYHHTSRHLVLFFFFFSGRFPFSFPHRFVFLFYGGDALPLTDGISLGNSNCIEFEIMSWWVYISFD
jgi:hypothetical protein